MIVSDKEFQVNSNRCLATKDSHKFAHFIHKLLVTFTLKIKSSTVETALS